MCFMGLLDFIYIEKYFIKKSGGAEITPCGPSIIVLTEHKPCRISSFTYQTKNNTT